MYLYIDLKTKKHKLSRFKQRIKKCTNILKYKSFKMVSSNEFDFYILSLNISAILATC